MEWMLRTSDSLFHFFSGDGEYWNLHMYSAFSYSRRFLYLLLVVQYLLVKSSFFGITPRLVIWVIVKSFVFDALVVC